MLTCVWFTGSGWLQASQQPQDADLKAHRFIEYDTKPSGDSTLHLPSFLWKNAFDTKATPCVIAEGLWCI